MVLELTCKVVREVAEQWRHQQLVCESVMAQLDYVAKRAPGVMVGKDCTIDYAETITTTSGYSGG